MTSLVLASGSPRRRRLLEEAGFRFEVAVPSVDESPRSGEHPADLVVRLARLKASTVVTEDVVLAADTVVALEGTVLGKPVDAEEAISMLGRLSGVTHQVLTGWAISGPGMHGAGGVETTHVSFRDLDHGEIRAYAATGEPLDKAGAYAIQGGAARFVESLDGSYSNVVGLPMGPVTAALARAGVVPVQPSG